MENVRPIQPELLAAKIEKIQNFEYPALLDQFGAEPTLVRLLWFLQFVSVQSNYPGGLGRFAFEFASAQSARIGTAGMAKAKPQGSRYALSDAIEILREIPYEERRNIFGCDGAKLINFEFEPADYVDEDDDQPRLRERERKAAARSLLVGRITPETARAICIEQAKQNLASYFKRVCELPHVSLRTPCPIDDSSVPYSERRQPEGSPWYFMNVADALQDFVSERAAAIRGRIADTEVTQLVSRWIQKSRNTRRSVMIIGNSRFGKTEAVKMNAEVAPGECRLVETPDSTAIGDLLRAVARTLGLEVGVKNQVRDLRERIEYVLRYSGLQLIFDESQMLLPGAFSRNTAPARLNWVRRSMMDRQIAVVFVCTPQSYLPAKKRFVNATGFAMEQFDERILKTVDLPKELSERDLLAVARIHFPNQHAEYLQFIVDQAIATERNFVSDISNIADLAKDNAQEAGRVAPNLADIETAMREVLPSVQSEPEQISQPSKTAPGKRSNFNRCKRSAATMQQPRRTQNLPIPNRETRPLITA